MGDGEPKNNINDIAGHIFPFDTVDHNILINILKEHYGFWDKALQCFEEY